ncbi:MAG: SDR family oxidoreductase [Gordonia sp. (in: high G+C Gram-positive bacteria)]
MTESNQKVLTVLVTGATSGIGAQVAEQFAAAGHRVYGTTRNPDSVREKIHGVTYVRLDNADYSTAQSCADEVGDVDILINNAGESHDGPLEDTPLESIEHIFAVNVFGPIALTKAVLPGMRARRTGTVVMVGSMLASFPVAFRSTYSATKAALKNYALSLRREVAPYGIRVISVEPGTIATGIGDRRNRDVVDDSPYRAEYETYAAAVRANEAKGISAESMAEQIVQAALAEKPRPFYARGNRAGLVFLVKRLVPQQVIIDIANRTHGLGRIRP